MPEGDEAVDLRDVKLGDITITRPGEEPVAEAPPAEEPEAPEEVPTEEQPEETPEEVNTEAPEETPEEETPEEEVTDDDAPSSESGSEGDVTEPSAEQKSEIETKYFSENFNGFNNAEEVNTHIEKLTANQITDEKALEFDLAEKFNAFREGRDGDDNNIFTLFLDTQIQDFDQMSDMDVLRFQMEANFPNREMENIEFKLNKKYKIGTEDEYEAEDVRFATMEMEEDAITARTELKNLQKTTALKEPAKAVQSKEDIQKNEESNTKWAADVVTSLSDFKSLELIVGDKGDEFKYEVKPSDEVKAIMENPNSFFERYETKDANGVITIDTDKFRNDLTKIVDFDNIIKAVSVNGTSKANEERLNTKRNPPKKDEGAAPKKETKSELGEIATAFKGKLAQMT